jgi:hypothetical protein
MPTEPSAEPSVTVPDDAGKSGRKSGPVPASLVPGDPGGMTHGAVTRRMLTTELHAERLADFDDLDELDPADPPNVVFHRTRERFKLVVVPQHFGGVRWYYVCPCGRRCGILYLRRGRFRCRTCHDLAYPSQNRTRRMTPDRPGHRPVRRPARSPARNTPRKPRCLVRSRTAHHHTIAVHAHA